LGGDRTLVVAREITKKFETISVVKLAEASQWLAEDPNRERGEFVLLVDAPVERIRGTAIDARELLMALIDELPASRAARVAAAVTGLPRDALYAHAVELKAGRS
jgi:16S rRNA (cytidine1402-2'-O)-methyltransferase